MVEAQARAARNGVGLEFGDTDAGPSWRGVRYVSVHLMKGREQVAGMAHSYRDEASRQRALSFCLKRVYSRPE